MYQYLNPLNIFCKKNFLVNKQINPIKNGLKEWMWIVEEDDSGTLPKKEDCRKWIVCKHYYSKIAWLTRQLLNFLPFLTSRRKGLLRYVSGFRLIFLLRFETKKYYFVRLIFLTYSVSYSMFSLFFFTLFKILSPFTHTLFILSSSCCVYWEFRGWVVRQFAILLVVNSTMNTVWNKVHSGNWRISCRH